MSTAYGTTATAPIAALIPVTGGQTEAPLLDGSTRRYVNFDYAASTPALTEVARHIEHEVMPYYASVHRGSGYLSEVSSAVYERARDVVARFVGARGDDVVVFTRNTTDAFTLLASAVVGRTLVLDAEHHANLLPWQRRGDRIIGVEPTIAATLAALERALADERFGLLAVSGASNVTGEVLPLAELAEIAHRHGARIAVDGAQLVPHRRIDIAALGVDYLAFSGHKVYAPYGSGALVGRVDWLDAAPAYLPGGGAVRSVTVAETLWADSPARHEGGSPNVVGVAALARALTVIDQVPDDEWLSHEHSLLRRLESGLDELGITTLRVFADSTERVGVVSFIANGYEPRFVATYLSAEHGIGVRDGRFCAHPLLDRLGVVSAVRASLGIGSSSEDVDALLAALRQLVTTGPTARYERTETGWAPAAETRRLPQWLGGEPLRTPSGSNCDV